MPKETFFNLPDEKRELIENISITEFAAKGFDKASVNTIVKNSGIAKGSFYQYFDDKKDLFLHLLMSVAAEKKIKYMSPVLQNPEENDFFTTIRELFISGLKFASEYPELEKLGLWITNNTSHPVYTEFMEKAGKISHNIYEDLLSKAQSRGELSSGFDISYISHLFPALLTSTMDYCLKNSSAKEISGISDISSEVMIKVDLMIDFFKNGIGIKQSK